MIAFECPSCQAKLKAPEDKIGAVSKCRRCGCPIQVPDPEGAGPAYAVPSLPQPEDNAAASTQWWPDGSSAPPPVRTIDQGTAADDYDAEPEESTSRASFSGGQVFTNALWLLDLIFDVRFKRYLTPYIVRVLWVLLLLSCFAGFFLSRFALPLFDTVSRQAADAARPDFSKTVPPPLPRGAPANTNPNPFADWLMGTVGYAIGTVFLLMIARVGAESLIVIFNISNDLKEAKRRFEQAALARQSSQR